MLFYAVYAVDMHNQSVQRMLLPKMDRFSLLEMLALHQTIDAFQTFDPKDFEMEVNSVQITVQFDDESAIISYGEPHNIVSYISFDMVFGYVRAYRLERISDSN